MALFDENLSDGVRITPSDMAVRGLTVRTSDQLRLFPQLIPAYGMVVRETIGLAEPYQINQRLNAGALDVLRLASRMLAARELILADGVGVALVEAIDRGLAIADRLGLTEQLRAAGALQVRLTDRVRLAVSLGNFFGADILEGLGLDEDMLGRVLAHAGLTDGVGVAGTVAPTLLLHVEARDAFALDPEGAVKLLLHPHLREGFSIEAGYLSPGGSFTTWAMNTRTGAVTEYADFVFNSFARMGNRYFGASSSGLYELLGDDDDGTDIIARVRGGYMQFGGTRLSRLKAAYIAGRGNGDMILKIIESDDRQYVYRATLLNQRSSKVHMGKGQRSRYFAFELVTTGQDFDLDTLEFVPIVVERRV